MDTIIIVVLLLNPWIFRRWIKYNRSSLWSQADSSSSILAYALVVRPTEKEPDEYCRVGIAEVNYEWMSRGLKSTVVLV
jgi:hypothetical protein